MGTRRKLSAAEEYHIAILYQRGKTYSELAARYKMTAAGIRNIVLRNGIETRPRQKLTLEEKVTIAYKYINQNRSTYRLADEYGVTAQTIANALEDCQVKRRDPQEAVRVRKEATNFKEIW